MNRGSMLHPQLMRQQRPSDSNIRLPILLILLLFVTYLTPPSFSPPVVIVVAQQLSLQSVSSYPVFNGPCYISLTSSSPGQPQASTVICMTTTTLKGDKKNGQGVAQDIVSFTAPLGTKFTQVIGTGAYGCGLLSDGEVIVWAHGILAPVEKGMWSDGPYIFLTSSEQINVQPRMRVCGIKQKDRSLECWNYEFADMDDTHPLDPPTCTQVTIPTHFYNSTVPWQFELVETNYEWTCGSLYINTTTTPMTTQAKVVCWASSSTVDYILPVLPVPQVLNRGIALQSRRIPIVQLALARSPLFILYENGFIWQSTLSTNTTAYPLKGSQDDRYLPPNEKYKQIAVSNQQGADPGGFDLCNIIGVTYSGATIIWQQPNGKAVRRINFRPEQSSVIAVASGVDLNSEFYMCYLTRNVQYGVNNDASPVGAADLTCTTQDNSPVTWLPNMALAFGPTRQCTLLSDGALFLSVGPDAASQITHQIYPTTLFPPETLPVSSQPPSPFLGTAPIQSGCCVFTAAEGVSCVSISPRNATLALSTIIPPTNSALKSPIALIRSDTQLRVCAIYGNGRLYCRDLSHAGQAVEPVPNVSFNDVTMNEKGRVCVIMRSNSYPVCAASVDTLAASVADPQAPVSWGITYRDGHGGIRSANAILPTLPTQPVKQVFITYETDSIPFLIWIEVDNGHLYQQVVNPSKRIDSDNPWFDIQYDWPPLTDLNKSNSFVSAIDCQLDGLCALASEGSTLCWNYPPIDLSGIGIIESVERRVPMTQSVSSDCSSGQLGGTCFSGPHPYRRRRLLSTAHDGDDDHNDDESSQSSHQRRLLNLNLPGKWVTFLTWVFGSISYSPIRRAMCGLTVPYSDGVPIQSVFGQVVCYDLTTGKSTHVSQDTRMPIDLPYQVAGLLINGSYLLGNQVQTCSLGSYSNEQGAINAICGGLCLEGTYGNSNSTDEQCTSLCPFGSFCPLGSSSPILCAAGRYGATLGLTDASCTDVCHVGYYCPLGVPNGIPCQAGWYGNAQGLSIPGCTGKCTAGFICSPGSTTPNPTQCGSSSFYCPEASGVPSFVTAGYYGDQPAIPTDLHANHTFTVRQICPPGYSCSGDGSKSECPIGTYSIAQSSYCTSCGTGRYQNETGQSTCIECATGKYQSDNGQTECHLCPAGKFSFDSLGAVYCQSCSPGSASNVTGLYSPDGCPPCPAGSYSSSTIECTLCSGANSYANISSSVCSVCTGGIVSPDLSACILDQPCPPNNYLDSVTHECQLCPLGQTSQRGARECSTCPYGTYTPGVGSGCISCNRPSMTGITCVGGLASVREGYWAYFNEATDEADLRQFYTNGANQTYQVYATSECPNQFCPGADLHVKNKTTNIEELTTANQCVSASRRLLATDNLLCAECADGYITWYGSCVSCSTVQSGAVILLLVISFLFTLFLYYASGGLSAGVNTIILYFVQTAQLEVGETSNILAWIRVFNLNLSNTGGASTCLGPLTPYQQTVLAILTPVILLVELYIIMIVHYIGYRLFSETARSSASAAAAAQGELSLDDDFDREVIAVPEERDYQPSRAVRQSLSSRPPTSSPRSFCVRWLNDFTFNRYVAGSFSILLFTYTQVGATALSFLHCVHVGDLGRVVFNEPSMRCDSDAYKDVSGLVITVLVVYICCGPLILLFLVGRHRDWIVEHSTAIAPRSKQYSYLIRFAPLISPFHARAWYWALLVLGKRLSFVIVNTFLILNPSVRACLFILLNFISYSLQVLIQPFKTVELNRIDQFSHISLVIVSALLSIYPRPPFSTTVQILLFVLIVPLPSILFVRGLTSWFYRQTGGGGGGHDLKTMQEKSAQMAEDVHVEATKAQEQLNSPAADDEVEMQQMPQTILQQTPKQTPKKTADHPPPSPQLLSQDSTEL